MACIPLRGLIDPLLQRLGYVKSQLLLNFIR
jgi:hypothetical protein